VGANASLIDSERKVRVFVSSTFRDMQAERDALNRVVFPFLRSECRKHCIDLIGIDLRWGITEEQADDKQTVKLCLCEVRIYPTV